MTFKEADVRAEHTRLNGRYLVDIYPTQSLRRRWAYLFKKFNLPYQLKEKVVYRTPTQRHRDWRRSSRGRELSIRAKARYFNKIVAKYDTTNTARVAAKNGVDKPAMEAPAVVTEGPAV